jgi:hypothetical protein
MGKRNDVTEEVVVSQEGTGGKGEKAKKRKKTKKQKKEDFVLPSVNECMTLTSREAFAQANTAQFRSQVLIEGARASGKTIRAQVKGKFVYAVKLTLGPFGASAKGTCSCIHCKKKLNEPNSYPFCKHVAGVILYLLGTPAEERDIYVADKCLDQRWAWPLGNEWSRESDGW